MPFNVNQRSVLLADEGPTVHVRVRPGWLVRSVDDHAPYVPVYWGGGDEIPNFDVYEAASLVAIGAMEVVI